MPLSPAIRRALYVLLPSLIASCVWAAESESRRLYEIVTETVMPHLEENLRYATTREESCLEQDELWSAFPILHHPALQDCRLDAADRQQDAVSYTLVCEGGHGTTGSATWQFGRGQITGTLNVRLGGKNMTFYQRITATALQDCSPS
jgi:hypothetical protein